MCGIAGHVGLGSGATRSPENARALVQAMTEAIHHRGPDASSVHQDGPAVFGHARLAIIDLRPTANQPMASRRRPGSRSCSTARSTTSTICRRSCAPPAGVPDQLRHGGPARRLRAARSRLRLNRCAACSPSPSGTPRAGASCWGVTGWGRSRCSFTWARAASPSRRSCGRCSPTTTSRANPTRARCMPTCLSASFRPRTPPSPAFASSRPARSRSTRTAGYMKDCAKRNTGSSSSRPGHGRWASWSKSCAISCSKR